MDGAPSEGCSTTTILAQLSIERDAGAGAVHTIMSGHPIIAVGAWSADNAAIREATPGDSQYRGLIAEDVSQKMTAVCVVDDAGRRLWRGQCPSVPEQINGRCHIVERRTREFCVPNIFKRPRLPRATCS
jgi:hypothetical protein